MRTFSLLAALAVLMPLAAAPVGGTLHERVADVPDRAFVLAMHGTSFNGLRAPQTPLLEAYLGERLRFTVAVPLGAEPHTFHLHGHPWRLPGQARVVDTVLLRPGDAHAFDVVAGGPDGHAGDWLYHCHVDDHVASGMWGVLRVYPYAARVLPAGDELRVTLGSPGAPVEGAALRVEVDGAAVAAHVRALGAGEYVAHVPGLSAMAGQLVVTAEHPEMGATVARGALGGAPVEAPTLHAGHA